MISYHVILYLFFLFRILCYIVLRCVASHYVRYGMCVLYCIELRRLWFDSLNCSAA